MFGTMTSLWKLFHYSPKKAERLKHVQSVLSLPELKIVKPSDTRWLSHKRCIRAIVKELSALIVTLNYIYDECGDAEAYGLCLALSFLRKFKHCAQEQRKSLPCLKSEMESQSGYKDLFPETLTLKTLKIDILLSLPVGTASVERSFSQMKLIKTRLRSRLNDSNLARLMRIAIEGPQLEDVNFCEILDIFKEKNRRIQF